MGGLWHCFTHIRVHFHGWLLSFYLFFICIQTYAYIHMFQYEQMLVSQHRRDKNSHIYYIILYYTILYYITLYYVMLCINSYTFLSKASYIFLIYSTHIFTRKPSGSFQVRPADEHLEVTWWCQHPRPACFNIFRTDRHVISRNQSITPHWLQFHFAAHEYPSVLAVINIPLCGPSFLHLPHCSMASAGP